MLLAMLEAVNLDHRIDVKLVQRKHPGVQDTKHFCQLNSFGHMQGLGMVFTNTVEIANLKSERLTEIDKDGIS